MLSQTCSTMFELHRQLNENILEFHGEVFACLKCVKIMRSKSGANLSHK